MKNSPSLIIPKQCRKGPSCPCPGITYDTIQRDGRDVGNEIGLAVVKVYQEGIKAPFVLIGWHDYHLLRNELDIKWDREPIVLNTPAGPVKVLVDPSVTIGVRALPAPGDYQRFLDHPKLLEPR